MRGTVEASFKDAPIKCVLDTGLERSIIGQAHTEGMPVQPSEKKELQMGKEKLEVVGRTCVIFRIEKHLMMSPVEVSPDVEGLTLGLDWLAENVSTWNMNTGRVQAYDTSYAAQLEAGAHMLRAWPQPGCSPLPDPVSAAGVPLPRKIAYGPRGYVNFCSAGPIEHCSAWKQQYELDGRPTVALPASDSVPATFIEWPLLGNRPSPKVDRAKTVQGPEADKSKHQPQKNGRSVGYVEPPLDYDEWSD